MYGNAYKHSQIIAPPPHSQQNIRTETDLNFAIKMPNVADDGVVLHEGEVLPSNDVLAA